MGVVEVREYRVETVEFPGFLDLIAELQPILADQMSGRNYRMYRSLVAGPDTGLIIMTSEYDDLAAYEEAEAKVSNSAEYQSFVDDRWVPEFPTAASEATSLWIDPSPEDADDGHRSTPEALISTPVLHFHAADVKAGRLRDAIEMLAVVEEDVMQRGASNSRTYRVALDGAPVKRIIVVEGYVSVASFGDVMDQIRQERSSTAPANTQAKEFQASWIQDRPLDGPVIASLWAEITPWSTQPVVRTEPL